MNKLGLLFALSLFALSLSGFGHADVGGQTAAVSAPVAVKVVAPAQADDALLPMATCLMCGSSSTGACSGARQCVGTRKECRKKGCKITGTTSCSTAANVKKC